MARISYIANASVSPEVPSYGYGMITLDKNPIELFREKLPTFDAGLVRINGPIEAENFAAIIAGELFIISAQEEGSWSIRVGATDSGSGSLNIFVDSTGAVRDVFGLRPKTGNESQGINVEEEVNWALAKLNTVLGD